jgi:hypothetical protein
MFFFFFSQKECTQPKVSSNNTDSLLGISVRESGPTPLSQERSLVDCPGEHVMVALAARYISGAESYPRVLTQRSSSSSSAHRRAPSITARNAQVDWCLRKMGHRSACTTKLVVWYLNKMKKRAYNLKLITVRLVAHLSVAPKYRNTIRMLPLVEVSVCSDWVTFLSILPNSSHIIISYGIYNYKLSQLENDQFRDWLIVLIH